MHYGMNMTKIVCNWSGSGNEKLDGIGANMNRIRLRSSTPMPSNSFKLGNGTPALVNKTNETIICLNIT